MNPNVLTSLALRLHSYRWWGAVIPVLTVAACFLLSSQDTDRFVRSVSVVVGPLVLVPWGFFCLCGWFHPARGRLQSNDRLFGRLPRGVQTAIRWYAAAFLMLWTLVGAIVMPLLARTWLG